jgi:hypothetical protein
MRVCFVATGLIISKIARAASSDATSRIIRIETDLDEAEADIQRYL